VTRGRLVRLACALGALALSGVGAAATPDRPLRTAIYVDPAYPLWSGASASTAFDRITRTGATVVRITLYWWQVAPETRPAQWDPTDPGDPNYDWKAIDAQVRNVVQRGLQPFLTIMAAPRWAQGAKPEPPPNSYLPDPREFGKFAKAAARRYSGNFRGLPRVSSWQAWNEPNISLYFVPQLEKGKPISPAWYRRMLNEFAAAVRSVNSGNLVVAAGLAPFRDITPSVRQQDQDWGPLSFMRELLCVSKSLRPTCNDSVSFDVWATHPYTSGGPQHHAVLPNDVSLGDLPEMRRTLDAAIEAGHVNSHGKVQFWVTEFSWDSKPPDPKGVPMWLLSRWIAESFYRMWKNGVSLVTWLMLRDEPLTNSYLQSGLYFRGATLNVYRPKSALQAFRFPFVALPSGGRVLVWGRTPSGRSGRVLVEQSFKGGWKQLGIVPTSRYGIFQGRFKTGRAGSARARLLSRPDRSIPFSLKAVPDRFFNPFGLDAILDGADEKKDGSGKR
jgi:hypothetical protein